MKRQILFIVLMGLALSGCYTNGPASSTEPEYDVADHYQDRGR